MQAINEVFHYVGQHAGFRASLGVITSSRAGKTILAWGAINTETEQHWVPSLDDVKTAWPDAQWTPMNQKQASLFDEAYAKEKSIRQEWLHSI